MTTTAGTPELSPAAERAPHARGQLRFDVLVTVSAKLLYVGLGALTTVIIARYFGPSGQGVFAVAFNLTLILIQLGSSGLNVATSTIVARESRVTGAVLTNSLLLALGGGMVLVGGTLLLKGLAPNALAGLSWVNLAVTLVALPAALASMFMQSVLQGQGRMVAFAAIDVAQASVTLAGVAVAIGVLGAGITAVLAALALARYCSLAISLVLLRRELAHPAPPDPRLLKTMLAFSFRIYAVGLITFLLIRLDLLLVNSILGQREAGLYSLAGYVSEALTVIPSIAALNMVAWLARERHAQRTDTSPQMFRAVLLFYGAICLLSLPVVALGMPLVYGSAYQESVTLYCWLLPGMFFLGLLAVLSVHYSVRGYPRALMAAWVGGLLLDIALNVALLRPVGLFVAPLSSTVAYGLVLAVHLHRFAPEAGGWGRLLPGVSDMAPLLKLRVAGVQPSRQAP
jgi:O-antigen/teichoic acid export membrane protein